MTLKFFDTVRAEELLEKAHVVICLADITDSDGCDTYLRSYWHVKSQNRGTIRHAYTLRTHKIHTFNTHTGGIPYIAPYKDPEQNLVTEDDEQEELNGGCCIVS